MNYPNDSLNSDIERKKKKIRNIRSWKMLERKIVGD